MLRNAISDLMVYSCILPFVMKSKHPKSHAKKPVKFTFFSLLKGTLDHRSYTERVKIFRFVSVKFAGVSFVFKNIETGRLVMTVNF
jgi:hypothetical protein